MKNAFRRHPYLISAFGLFTALALFFLVKFAMGAIYWAGHQREPVQPWMTIGYVAHSWDLKAREIDDRAGLPKPVDHPLTLQEIANQRGVPVADIVAQVEKTVAEMLAEREKAKQHD